MFDRITDIIATLLFLVVLCFGIFGVGSVMLIFILSIWAGL